MTPDHKIMIALLVGMDAAWTPNRRHVAAIYERRAAGTIPWSSRVAGDIDRRDTSHHLAELHRAGLVLPKADAGRTTKIALPLRGVAHARALIGDAQPIEELPLLHRLADLIDTNPHAGEFLGDWHFPEDKLAGVVWGAPESTPALADLQIRLTPSLTAGLVVSRCTVQKHVWYTVTPAGRDFIADPPPRPRDLPREIPGGGDFYQQQFSAERAALATAEPENTSELFEIPMPVCPRRRCDR